MKKLVVFTILMLSIFLTYGQGDKVLHIIAIGAHPDDCDTKFGGTAALLTKMGHKVKFLALTNGDAGHQNIGGGVLAKRRREEARRAGDVLGVEYEVLDNHDAELIPSLHIRHQIIRRIREWNADVVLGLRPNDYHPDHRNAGIAVQDAAYLVIVPNVTPDTPPLTKNPVFLYMNDNFEKPYRFSKDIMVIVDKVFDQKVLALSKHDSQMFEWGPWTEGIDENTIPKEKDKRLEWLKKRYKVKKEWSNDEKEVLTKWYPGTNPESIKYVEFFEICEYGKQPSDEEIKQLFPMLGNK